MAGQYFWHRFFSHQPDLNYDNPEVREEIWRIMRFWLEQGVDGFRVDAVPYLVEREGTSCENLPETHQVLRWLCQRLEEAYPRQKVLLAEATMWPEDVRPYFADGDEFHMAFHFPLMPSLFMALRLEDRKPVVKIMERTPAIPEPCQWGLFLRNHDELTLEMVTDIERDYMWDEYAKDPLARLFGRGELRFLRPTNHRVLAFVRELEGEVVLFVTNLSGMAQAVELELGSWRAPSPWSSSAGASSPG